MSTYITLQGSLCFPDQVTFAAAVALLEDGGEGWIQKGVFVDECKDPLTTPERPATYPDTREIVFPYGLYRNIGLVVDQIYPGTTGTLVWTCTDGCFQGGVIDNGVETLTDLEQWAKESEMEKPNEPLIDDGGEFDRRADWMTEVEQAFNEEYIH